MRLHQFILDNLEGIQQEWEDFAADYLSDANGMNKDQLRDHLREMLLTIAADLARPQSASDQSQKAKGQQIFDGSITAAATHGSERLGAGFSLNSTVSEFRALRASVTRLWIKQDFTQISAETDLGDLIRFNEAIDQAITESVVGYSTVKEYDSRMFGTILTSCSDLIFNFDLEGRFVYANKQLKDLFGLSMEQMAGKNYYDLNVPIAAELHGQIEQAIRTKASVYLEAPSMPFSGKSIGYDYVFTPVFDKVGEVESVVCIGHDVTERRMLEQDLIKADRRKDEFLATLAHELRNPLCPLHSGLQILQMNGKADATAQKIHSMMDRQVNHLIRLVDDLLEVSRITEGKIELRREPIELAAVIHDAVECCPSLNDAGKHRLTVSLPSEPLRLVADPIRLTQVFSNLLNNAAKYTEAGGVIDISAKNEKGEAVVSIRDSGVGIPANMLSQVFDLFTQVDSNLGRARDGLGIGLAIVRSLVEMHGGRVEAHSPGFQQGSEFIVYLPLADESTEAAKPARSVEPATSVMRRILITDDNRDVADAHAMLLMALGTDVRVAYDGEAALNALAEFKPEILILDIGMPYMDGYEIARRVRQHTDGQHIQLVALTGWGRKEDRQRSLDAGFNHHLAKPVGIGQFEALLTASVAD